MAGTYFDASAIGRHATRIHAQAVQRFDAPVAVTWRRSDDAPTVPARLMPRHADYSRQQWLIWAASELPGGDDVRERELTRRVLDERMVAWRNHEASLDIASLEPHTRMFSTYLLQEYFIPVAAFLQFAEGESWRSLNLTGAEIVSIGGIAGLLPRQVVSIDIAYPDGTKRTIEAKVRIDTENELDYFRNGGILHYVLRELARAS